MKIYAIGLIIFILVLVYITTDGSLIIKLQESLFKNKFSKLKPCNKEILEFAINIKNDMGIRENLFIAIDEKNVIGGTVNCFENNLFIILENNLLNDNNKFIIAHELGHVKNNYFSKKCNNFIFITLLCFTVSVFFMLIIKNEKLVEAIVYLIFAFALILCINEKRLCSKNNHIEEHKADLIAAQFISLKTSVSSLNKLKDRKTWMFSTHPNKKDRIAYISKNIN